MKITAMIPALLGSTRIPDKNLVLVDGQILSSYTVKSCKLSNVFDDIYLNSDSDIFANIAKQFGVHFYQRKANFGGQHCEQKNKSRQCTGQRCVINDHYLYDFMKNTDSDYVFQVNSTSPLLKAQTIKKIVNKMISKDYNSIFSTFDSYAESFYENHAINFTTHKKTPSQELKPIQSICWAIAGWNVKNFLQSYEENNLGKSGPVYNEPIGLIPINEIEALDIDEWSTLHVVEGFLKQEKLHIARKTEYYTAESAKMISETA